MTYWFPGTFLFLWMLFASFQSSIFNNKAIFQHPDAIHVKSITEGRITGQMLRSVNQLSFTENNGCFMQRSIENAMSLQTAKEQTTRAKMNDGLNNLRDLQIIGSGNNAIIYAVGDSGTLIKSTDAGLTWLKKETGIPGDLYWVHFTTAYIGMVYTNEGVSFQTFDGGVRWQSTTNAVAPLLSLSALASGNQITDIYWDLNNRAYATINTLAGVGIIATSQNGISWRQASSFTAPGITCVQQSGLTAYAGGSDGVLLKSITGGVNWQQLVSGFTGNIDALYFSNDKTGSVLSLNTGQISVTTDSGTTWNTISELKDVRIIAMQIQKDTGYALSDAGNLYCTYTGGQSWQPSEVSIQSGLSDYGYTAVSTPDEHGYFYIGNSVGQLFVWDGMNWNQLMSAGMNLPVSAVKKILLGANKQLYVLCAGSVYKTNSRTLMSDPISVNVYPIEPGVTDIAFSDTITMNTLAITPRHIFSSQNGRIWTDNSGNISPVILNGIASEAFDTYAVGADGRIFLSNDGISWQLQQTGSRIALNDVAVSGIRVAAISTRGGALFSTDGATWKPAADSVPKGISTIRASGTMYFGASKDGVLYSSADGNTWTDIHAFDSPVTINKIAINTSGVFMAIGVGNRGTIISSSDGNNWRIIMQNSYSDE